MSGLTGRIGRSYARLTMPTPEPTRAGRRGKDVSAIPTFLREGAQPRANRPVGTSPGKATLPRPATPPEPRPEPAPRRLDPAALPMPSLSRRRVVTVAGVLVASLLAISFLRQVGEATAASNRAAELRAANAALQAEVAQLQQDLTHVQDPRYIQLEGRAFGLGARGEVPFALAAGATALAADAPGSAAVRLGAAPLDRSPLDVWLEVLFGAGG
jgi:cell division protein FtsB